MKAIYLKWFVWSWGPIFCNRQNNPCNLCNLWSSQNSAAGRIICVYLRSSVEFLQKNHGLSGFHGFSTLLLFPGILPAAELSVLIRVIYDLLIKKPGVSRVRSLSKIIFTSAQRMWSVFPVSGRSSSGHHIAASVIEFLSAAMYPGSPQPWSAGKCPRRNWRMIE